VLEALCLETARRSGPWSSAWSALGLGARVASAVANPPPWRREQQETDAPLAGLVRSKGGAFWDLLVLPSSSDDLSAPCILLIPPMSGHHPTLLRDQVLDLHPHAHVALLAWRAPSTVPLFQGAFGVEEQAFAIGQAAALARTLWPGRPLHAVAVCQPVPELLAMTAYAMSSGGRPFHSLTLMAGPVDTQAAPTEVSKAGAALPLDWARWVLCRPLWVGPAAGRWIYPGTTQLAAFMSMNPDRHRAAFEERIRTAPWAQEAHTPFTRFYDEYMAVVDLPAEFYVQTLQRVFQDRDLIHRRFMLGGVIVDTDVLASVPLAVVEGERDDICAPGQCASAFDLIPVGAERLHWVAPGVGHYGVFSGRIWRAETLPRLLGFWRSV
jgi:poly(3-hydroxybutyrate) depolymerase